MPLTLKEELGKRKPFDCPEQEAYLNILRSASVIGGPVSALLKEHGLSDATYNVLRILRGATLPGAAGRRTCTEVGEQMVTLVPDVTRLVDRLEDQGLVARERCTEDRRVVYIRITRRGLDLLARLDRPLVEVQRAQLGHMPRAELAELSRLLVKARQKD